MRSAIVAVACIIIAGCGPDTSYFPMEEGATSEYVVRTSMAKYVQRVEVAARTSVGTASGFVLKSDTGTSRIAWTLDGLVASELSGTLYRPPVPLLLPSSTATKRWRGLILSPGSELEATGELEQIPERIRVGSRDVEGIKATLTLDTPKGQQITISRYAPEHGLVSQEQRIKRPDGTETLHVSLELLSGP